MNNKDIAVQTYKYFATLEGNQCIATEFAIKVILDIIEDYNAKNILEMGVGIGAISFGILDYAKINKKNLNFVGTEANDFCLKVLPQYLKEHYSKIKLFYAVNSVSSDELFDVIIIDGIDDNMNKVEKIISKNGIIIIEGDRQPQLAIIKNIFPNSRYTRVISNYKNPDYGPIYSDHFCGGVQLIFTNPTIKQKLDFYIYKIKTAVKYRLR